MWENRPRCSRPGWGNSAPCKTGAVLADFAGSTSPDRRREVTWVCSTSSPKGAPLWRRRSGRPVKARLGPGQGADQKPGIEVARGCKREGLAAPWCCCKSYDAALDAPERLRGRFPGSARDPALQNQDHPKASAPAARVRQERQPIAGANFPRQPRGGRNEGVTQLMNIPSVLHTARPLRQTRSPFGSQLRENKRWGGLGRRAELPVRGGGAQITAPPQNTALEPRGKRRRSGPA